MGNGASSGQGSYTTYGSQDVERETEQEQPWPPKLAAETNRKSYSLFLADPNLYNGAYNAGLESSEDSNRPNMPNSTEDLRRGASTRHRRPVNNEASDSDVQRGALRSSLWNHSVPELAEHPNHPNLLTARDEPAVEFPDSTTSNDRRREATEPNYLQEPERPNSSPNSEDPEEPGSTVRPNAQPISAYTNCMVWPNIAHMNGTTNMQNPNSEPDDPKVCPNVRPSGAYANYVRPSTAHQTGRQTTRKIQWKCPNCIIQQDPVKNTIQREKKEDKPWEDRWFVSTNSISGLSNFCTGLCRTHRVLRRLTRVCMRLIVFQVEILSRTLFGRSLTFV